MGQSRKNRQSKIAKTLGASRVVEVPTRRASGPLSWIWLGQVVRERLVSSGGRPSDPNWDTKRLVPFRKNTWKQLSQEAEAISTQGRKVGPAQLAAILIEGTLTPSENLVTLPAESLQISFHANFEVQRAFGSSGGETTPSPNILLSMPTYHAATEEEVQSEWSPEEAPKDLVRSGTIAIGVE